MPNSTTTPPAQDVSSLLVLWLALLMASALRAPGQTILGNITIYSRQLVNEEDLSHQFGNQVNAQNFTEIIRTKMKDQNLW